MPKFRILIPNKMISKAVSYLKNYAIIDYYPIEQVMPEEEFIKKLSKVNGLIIPTQNKISKKVLKFAPHLKGVSNMAVGFDNLDLKALTEKKIMATNTPGVLTETVADLVFGLIISVARRIPEANQFVKQGKYHGWQPSLMLGTDVHHKRLGIIGYGRIGRAVAKRAKGFSMDVVYYNDIHRNIKDEKKIGISFLSLKKLLKTCDFVLIQVPLTTKTKGMISKEEFSLMKKQAILINAARGKVVDEESLIEALKNHQISGAGLDVTAKDPIEKNNPLLKMKNVIITPHIGSATIETRTKMEMLAAKNMIEIIKGQKPKNLLNPKVFN